MSEEIFDIVDDRDRVTGKQTRQEVHRRGLKHRAIHVLVVNERGEVYLQKRSFKKDTFPGAWDSSSSGHVDSGETYDACAVRETREEIGLFLKRTPKRLFKVDACAETGLEFVWVYRCDFNGPFRLNPDEIECGAFFKPDHINRWMAERPRDFADAFRLIWKYFLNPPPPKAATVAKPIATVAKPTAKAAPVARPIAKAKPVAKSVPKLVAKRKVVAKPAAKPVAKAAKSKPVKPKPLQSKAPHRAQKAKVILPAKAKSASKQASRKPLAKITKRN
jgi:isopentenyldiphosphate isomerase